MHKDVKGLTAIVILSARILLYLIMPGAEVVSCTFGIILFGTLPHLIRWPSYKMNHNRGGTVKHRIILLLYIMVDHILGGPKCITEITEYFFTPDYGLF